MVDNDPIKIKICNSQIAMTISFPAVFTLKIAVAGPLTEVACGSRAAQLSCSLQPLLVSTTALPFHYLYYSHNNDCFIMGGLGLLNSKYSRHDEMHSKEDPTVSAKSSQRSGNAVFQWTERWS
jgi:hypothetical protein